MTPAEEMDACLFELRTISALMAMAEAIEDGDIEPEDILTALGLESGERG